jgi:hydrogenase nickel incorporation protein HypA/HybF
MHELSIAMSIVEMAEEEIERGHEVQVNTQVKVQVIAVHLKLGALSGVEKKALLSSFEIACADSPLKGSNLLIEEVPVSILCSKCQAPRPVSSIQLFCCAECGTPSSEVVEGKEIEVVALEIEQWAPSHV